MLYTLADKFLDKAELDEIKEVIRMTRLGQMLMDEGMELKETDSIKKLMKNMNWTIDQAMNALEVTEDDYAALSLTPLMSGKMSRKDMFKEAICLAKPNIELSAEKTTAMLYTLADKFLDRTELDEIKEVIRMTRLGQMLMDEGMEKGIELKETDSIKKLMKNMNLTIDQAMNALEVPADKREKYRKTITPDN